MNAVRRFCVLCASSVFGLGYLPVAPGTWGTFAALPIWWATSTWPVSTVIWMTLLAVLLAIWISSAAERYYGAHDVGHIVIDEVVGLLCTVIAVPWRLPQILCAFVLFRLLDALKPAPISYIDARVDGGLGVVLDDVVAGLLGCAILHSACYLYGGWW